MTLSIARTWFLAMVLAGTALAVACGGSAGSQTVPTVAPAVPTTASAVATIVSAAATMVPATTAPTKAAVAPAAPTKAGGSPSGQSRVDLNKIFPEPAEMRDLVMGTCTNCHTFVPIVILRFDKGLWEQNKEHHRAYVTNITEAQRDALYSYLAANFNPDKPVPELPPELLATWTSY